MSQKVLHPKIKKATQIPVYVKALIYGEPGAGKTYLSCTAPNPIILMTEYDVSLATIVKVQKDLGREIAVWEVQSLEDIEEAYQYLVSGKHNFETVVLDSITDFNNLVVRFAVDYALKKKPVHDPDILEMSDWQRVIAKMQNIVVAFRALPMHVVVNALVATGDDLRKGPAVTPKSLAATLPAMFNMVGALAAVEQEGQVVRKLLVSPNDRYIAKNPGGLLPPVIDNPNLTKIFEEVVANGKTST